MSGEGMIPADSAWQPEDRTEVQSLFNKLVDETRKWNEAGLRFQSFIDDTRNRSEGYLETFENETRKYKVAHQRWLDALNAILAAARSEAAI